MDLTIVAVWTISDDLLISIGDKKHPQAKMSDAEVMTATEARGVSLPITDMLIKNAPRLLLKQTCFC